ncbi:hypothetical protein LINPERHAP2_LOCUS14514 [Linum perenne]
MAMMVFIRLLTQLLELIMKTIGSGF